MESSATNEEDARLAAQRVGVYRADIEDASAKAVEEVDRIHQRRRPELWDS